MSSPGSFTAHSIEGLSKITFDPKNQDLELNQVTLDIMQLRVDRTELVRNHFLNITTNVFMNKSKQKELDKLHNAKVFEMD
jgi:hypothetical protein